MIKFRIRFQKADDLRFLSHHDLMRLIERMLRRADLPFALTEGFHPKPRMQFPSALALGVIGWEEVVEIEFREPMAAEEVQRRLEAQTLPGLKILSVREIPRKRTGQVVEAWYRLNLPPEPCEGLAERIAEFMASSQWIVQRRRPQPKPVDVRPFVLALRLNGNVLEMQLRVAPDGSARAEEVLEALGLHDVLFNGGVLERTRLVLADELEPTASNNGRAVLNPAPTASSETQECHALRKGNA